MKVYWLSGVHGEAKKVKNFCFSLIKVSPYQKWLNLIYKSLAFWKEIRITWLIQKYERYFQFSIKTLPFLGGHWRNKTSAFHRRGFALEFPHPNFRRCRRTDRPWSWRAGKIQTCKAETRENEKLTRHKTDSFWDSVSIFTRDSRDYSVQYWHFYCAG